MTKIRRSIETESTYEDGFFFIIPVMIVAKDEDSVGLGIGWGFWMIMFILEWGEKESVKEEESVEEKTTEPKVSEAKSAATFGGKPHAGLQVLRSRQGFYIGTLYREDDGLWYPYERLSAKYWALDKKAKEALATGRYEKQL